MFSIFELELFPVVLKSKYRYFWDKLFVVVFTVFLYFHLLFKI